MRFTDEQRRVSVWMVLVLAGLWSAVTAAPATAQVPRRATPASPFHGPIDSASPEAIFAYLRELEFVDEGEFGDRQALLVGRYPDSASFGPLVKIQPEAGNYLISDEGLSRGRIVARIVNESPDSYPRLALRPHGRTYWWVEYDARTRAGRSVLVAADSQGNIVELAVRALEVVEYHKEYRVHQPLARFVWREMGEMVWAPCGVRCCKT